MSKYRKIRDTRDANHSRVVGVLKTHGYGVEETERPFDVIIRRKDGVCGFAEIKVEGQDGMIKRSQVEAAVTTSFPIAFVQTDAEALRFAETMKGLSHGQKNRLAALLMVRLSS